MSRLKKRTDDKYYSCFESICVEGMSEEEADQKYKEAALKILMDEGIEDMLSK